MFPQFLLIPWTVKEYKEEGTDCLNVMRFDSSQLAVRTTSEHDENTPIRREVKFESINMFNFDSEEYLG